MPAANKDGSDSRCAGKHLTLHRGKSHNQTEQPSAGRKEEHFLGTGGCGRISGSTASSPCPAGGPVRMPSHFSPPRGGDFEGNSSPRFLYPTLHFKIPHPSLPDMARPHSPAWTSMEMSQSVTDLSQNKTQACLVHPSPGSTGETSERACRRVSLSWGRGGAGVAGEATHSSRGTSLDPLQCHRTGQPP